jgi:CubicO group peptidase (beta-lactamase class C family)
MRNAILDVVFERAILERVFPGAQLAVYYQGRPIINEIYGKLSDSETAPPVQRETLYDIASVTKVFATASAIACLLDAGEMSLNSLASQWLTELSGPSKRIEIKHLLSHCSGLPSTWPLRFEFEVGTDRDFLIDHLLSSDFTRIPSYRAQRRTIHNRSAKALAPLDHTEYSDLGFIALGVLIERLSQTPYEQFFRAHIARPLGLTTRFLPSPEQCAPSALEPDGRGLIQGQVHDSKAWLLGGVAGHAGLFSNAGELATFGEAVRTGHGSLKCAKTLRGFGQRVGLLADAHWGLGWKTNLGGRQAPGPRFSESCFGHDGFTGCSLWIDPEAQLTMALTANRTYPNGPSDREQSAELLQGLRRSIMEAVLEQL